MKKQVKIIIYIIMLLVIAGISFGLNGYMDMYITMLPVAIMFLIIITIPIIIPYVLGIFSAKRSILSKDDFKNNEQYYREIIKKYSPACLSYIDDFDIGKEVIVATLLSLKLKKKIEILDDKILIINNDTIDLNNTEINILNNIKNDIVEVHDFNQFKQLAQEEALNAKLITNEKPKMKGSVLVYIMVILILFIGMSADYLSTINGYVSEGSLNIISIIMIILALYYAGQKNYSALAKVRTEKGNEINKKLEGLKQYIKQFSTLDEKNSEFINIWDEYLIYSVIFKQNKKIEKEVKKLIKIDKEEF